MKDFFYTKKFKVLLVCAVLLAGTMAWAGANGRLTSAPQELLGALLTPFQTAARAISGGISNMTDKYLRIDDVIAENEALKKENRLLLDKVVDYDKLLQENQAFRDLHNIEENNPDYDYASAFIIGRDPLEQFSGFTIDQGTLSGVKNGDVVVSDQGYLVGRIADATLTSSKVMTILQPSSYVACVVSRTRDSGNLNGKSEYALQGLCVLENLSRDTLAMVGDEVITTGLGGEFPPDIRIGMIEEILPEESGTSTLALIAPGEDINSIKHVFVIVSQT